MTHVIDTGSPLYHALLHEFTDDFLMGLEQFAYLHHCLLFIVRVPHAEGWQPIFMPIPLAGSERMNG